MDRAHCWRCQVPGTAAAATPQVNGLVPAHGDFDADQLLDAGCGEPIVLDFHHALLDREEREDVERLLALLATHETLAASR